MLMRGICENFFHYFSAGRILNDAFLRLLNVPLDKRGTLCIESR